MANIQVSSHPHIHSGNSTHKYMLDLPMTTYPMAVIAIIIQFFFAMTFSNVTFVGALIIALKAAVVIFTGVFSCILAESLWWRYVEKKYDDFAGWFRSMATTYPSITGMLYGLMLPIGLFNHIYVVIIGGFVAVIIGKTVFGGVGHNIFNPALIGRVFVTIAYAKLLSDAVVYTGLVDSVDAIASASPLTQMASQGGLMTYAYFKETYGSIWKLFFGFYPSALGEGLSFWIIGAFIYLSIRKTIEWYVPTIYVGLIFVMTWAVALMNNLDTASGLGTLALYFPLTHVLTGGLLFGAVFMATEPVTTPLTRRGKVIFAVYVALLTFAFRLLGNYPEGVMFSILLMNMVVPLIDGKFMGQNKGISWKEWIFWGLTAAIVVGLTIYASVRLGGAL